LAAGPETGFHTLQLFPLGAMIKGGGVGNAENVPRVPAFSKN